MWPVHFLNLIRLNQDEELARLEAMESYIRYKAFYFAEEDPMTQEDLAQEAREAIIKALRKDHYPRSYLRKVVQGAMIHYLRQGRSVDYHRPRQTQEYRIMSLDRSIGDGTPLEEVIHVRGSFEDMADARMMLNQLEAYLNERERYVFNLLRKGYSQADVARMMGCTRSWIYYIMEDIRRKAKEVWRI